MDDKLFENELNSINQELQEIDNLYNEVKGHYDNVKNSFTPGSLTFIEKQTTNLVALKKAKLDLLKEIVNTKRILTDFDYKDKQLEAKKQESQALGLSVEVYKKITNIISDHRLNNDEEDDELLLETDNSIELSEEDIDNALDEQLKDDDFILLNDDEEENEVQNVIDKTELVADEDGSVYEINGVSKELKFKLKAFKVDKNINSVYDEDHDTFYPLM